MYFLTHSELCESFWQQHYTIRMISIRYIHFLSTPSSTGRKIGIQTDNYHSSRLKLSVKSLGTASGNQTVYSKKSTQSLSQRVIKSWVPVIAYPSYS